MKLMKTVLFVCVGNSGRSQMAEAFLNHYAEGKAKALSAGTNPAANVEPTVVKVMKEVGIDVSGNKPKPLIPEMIDQANLVITMGCSAEAACPASWIETRDWGLEDPKDKPIEKVRQIRDEIKARVINLLQEIEKEE
jgi:protein-tyrosine-phosphatase